MNLGNGLSAIAIEDKRSPVARMAKLSPGMQKLQLGQPQGFRFRLMLFEQVVIKVLHELRRWLIWNAPQCGESRTRSGSQQCAAEGLNAFPGNEASAFGIAGGKRRQADAAKIEIVKLFEK